MRNLLIALTVIFGAFVAFSALMIVTVTVAPEWTKCNIGLMTMQAIQSILLFGTSTYFGIKLTETGTPLKNLMMYKRLSLRNGLIIIMFAITVIPAITAIAEWNNSLTLPERWATLETILRDMENQAQLLSDRFLHTSSALQFLANLFVMAVIPAICEEMMFRGWLQRRLSDFTSNHYAVFISAAVFSLIHFQFYGFIPRMIMGLAFGYIYLFTGTLWAPILAHFINNTVVVSVSFAEYNNCTTTAVSSLGTGETWYIGIISAVISFMMIFLLHTANVPYKGNQKRQKN